MKFCCRGVRGSRTVVNTVDTCIHSFARFFLSLNKEELLSLDNDLAAVKKYLHKAFIRHKLQAVLGYGNNTPCVELQVDNKEIAFIFDLGSGSSNIVLSDNVKSVHIFFTHFHYDHIIGLPFTKFLQRKDLDIHFYGHNKHFEQIIRNYLKPPFFPIDLDRITGYNEKVYFHSLYGQSNICIDNKNITWMKLNHPGVSYAYKVEDNGKSFCYFTDVTIIDEYFIESDENSSFLNGIDSMIIDASLNFSVSLERSSWGHTGIYEGINFATKWGIKKLYLFHYDPEDDELAINVGYQTVLWYKKMLASQTKVFLSHEEQWVTV